MEKYLLLLGFQLTQTAFIGMLDGSVWREAASGGLRGALQSLDADALGLMVQTLLSGTWVGRIADLGDLLIALARGAEGLPLALVVLQWCALVLWLAAERMFLERRLRQIDAAGRRGNDSGDIGK